MKCINQIEFCRAHMCSCDHVGRESECAAFRVEADENRKIPSIKEVEEMYHSIHGTALSEHNKAVVIEINRFCRTMQIDKSSPITVLSYDMLERYIGRLVVKNVTKIGALNRLQALVGRKERATYRKLGFTVNPIDIPFVEDDTKAYQTLRDELSLKVLNWYHGLLFEKDSRRRIVAMMMLKYAMRNGDVFNLKWSNFKIAGSRWRLEYTPHKTEKATAGRHVSIWLSPMDQVELANFKGTASDGDFVIPRKFGRMGIDGLERSLNKSIRKLGFTGSKGLYELRKMCIDTVFHALGAESASAYSGDDFKTVKFHYADTSSLNLHGIGDEMIGRYCSVA